MKLTILQLSFQSHLKLNFLEATESMRPNNCKSCIILPVNVWEHYDLQQLISSNINADQTKRRLLAKQEPSAAFKVNMKKINTKREDA